MIALSQALAHNQNHDLGIVIATVVFLIIFLVLMMGAFSAGWFVRAYLGRRRYRQVSHEKHNRPKKGQSSRLRVI